MIPLSLSIEGLYSYREKQIIDFEKLTSNGLFGIFGEVGSGKSSILEAMMFVLFDDTERLNKSGDERYYNMLNLQSSRFCIDFTFLAGKGNKEKYRFACTAKRNSNPEKFEDVKISKNDRQHYKWDGVQWMPLEGVKDATDILGMDYRNFMQTVIIPQGKFREFVDQTSGDRTKMLKELFRLHSFDLGPNTGKLQKETDLKIQHVQGQLESLGECKPEVVQELKEEIKTLEESIAELGKKIEEEKKSEGEWKSLQQLHEQLSDCRNQLKKLENEKPLWDERAQRLKTYSDAYTHFYEKLRQQHTLNKELKDKQEQSTQLQEQLSNSRKQQQQAKENFEQAKKEYEQKEQVQRKIDDLERIIRIKGTEEKLNSSREHHQQLEAGCRKDEKESLEAKETWQKLEERIHKLESSLSDISRLSEAYQWLQKKEDVLSHLQNGENNLAEKKEELAETLEQRKTLLQDLPELLPLNDWQEIFNAIDEKRKKQAEEETAGHKKLRELHVQQKLTEYADSLQDGQPCPLCGATEHPEIAVSAHVEQACREQEEKIKAVKQQQEQLSELLASLKELQAEQRHIEQNLNQQQKQVQEQQQQLQEHEKAFAWPEHRSTEKAELHRMILKTREAHTQIKAFRVQLAGEKKAAEEKAAQYEARCKELQQVERQLSEQEGILKTQKEALHADNHSWLKHDMQLLQESLKKGQTKLQQITQTFESTQQQLNKLNESTSALQARHETTLQTIAELQKKQEDQAEEIAALCREKGFEGTDKIREILSLRLNTEDEERQITQYRQNLHSTREKLLSLEQQTGGREYKQEGHQKLLLSIKENEQQCEEKKNRKSKLEHRKAELESKMTKSLALQKELEALELRRENLKELAGLFRGSGFVDYVSTIHLQELCRVANERFFKLTRNNLSLELNEQNNFIVRDYLNGGRTRLLKTLSGGQTFQAALCLALAMAENIKSLNEADQSFFFLDEGFGALDKESLRIVFDTLKSLRQENRIVGVISHVEDLQQEIEVYLKVENDSEKGSLVNCSWE